MKRVDLLVAFERGPSVSLRVSRTSGRLSHFFHFMQDFVWPFFEWLRAEDFGVRGGIQSVAVTDQGLCEFSGLFERFFGSPLHPARARECVALAVSRPSSRVRLHGYNSRFRDFMKTFDDVDGFRSSTDAFRTHMQSRFSIVPGVLASRSVVLIEREPGVPDRGARRRSINDHPSLRGVLLAWCQARGVPFENVRLAELDIAEQVSLCSNAAVLVGQHGAGLANAVWLEPGKSSVLELTDESSAMHFRNLAEDLRLRYRRLVFPAAPTGSLSVASGVVVDCLEELWDE